MAALASVRLMESSTGSRVGLEPGEQWLAEVWAEPPLSQVWLEIEPAQWAAVGVRWANRAEVIPIPARLEDLIGADHSARLIGARLGQRMAPKQITVCEDETFHPEPCLVAIEPISNFSLLEQYAVALNLPLHTFNRKHYAAIPNLVTVEPYSKS